MKQKDFFLIGEGNAVFTRNADILVKQWLSDSDPLMVELLSLKGQFAVAQRGGRVLKVGCGSGVRLVLLQQNMGLKCHGIKPSDIAVSQANSAGLNVQVGTADQLPFAGNSFYVVIFGFCLYLCDRDDLFKIAAEADRVLKNQEWLLFKAFFSPKALAKAYHPKAGVHSYKMDNKTLLTWNPDHSVYSNRFAHHSDCGYTDDRHEWVATSVLRKCRQS